MAQEILKHLYDNQLAMDVALKVPNDDRQIRTHRTILIGASKQFEERFTGDWCTMELARPVVVVHGMDFDTLEMLIKLIYTGEIQFQGSCTFRSAILGANILGIASAIEKLSQHVTSRLCSDDIFDFYSLADKLTEECAQTLEQCLRVMIRVSIISDHNLRKLRFQQLQRIVHRERAEKTLLVVVRRWIDAVPGNERHAFQLLSSLKFNEKLSTKFILNHIHPICQTPETQDFLIALLAREQGHKDEFVDKFFGAN